MTQILDYVEAESRANMAFHISNADALSKESNTLLNLMLASAGGLLAFAVGLVDKSADAWQIGGVTVASAYLFAVAGLLVRFCLWVQPIWPPANEPKNFPLEGYELENIRVGELANRQTCIERNVARNESVGDWLNRCRSMAAAAPVVATAGAAAVWAVSVGCF